MRKQMSAARTTICTQPQQQEQNPMLLSGPDYANERQHLCLAVVSLYTAWTENRLQTTVYCDTGKKQVLVVQSGLFCLLRKPISNLETVLRMSRAVNLLKWDPHVRALRRWCRARRMWSGGSIWR